MVSVYSLKNKTTIPAITRIYINGLLNCSKNMHILERDFSAGRRFSPNSTFLLLISSSVNPFLISESNLSTISFQDKLCQAISLLINLFYHKPSLWQFIAIYSNFITWRSHGESNSGCMIENHAS